MEEALIRWQERFGAEHEFKIYMRKWFSAPKVVIRLADEPFNPLKNDIADDESIFSNDVMNNLLHYDEAKTIYRYENGYNELISFSTKERKPIKIPENYFPNDDESQPPIVSWRAHANLLYSNWLNYFVYQTTPYDIKAVQLEK